MKDIYNSTKTVNKERKKAAAIGGICTVSYLTVYFSKNILGITSPEIIEDGRATAAQIGRFSSIYFIVYAVGQLINGALGDRIKPKYIISAGLLFGGICCALFPACFAETWLACLVYAVMGFSLSMVYAPTVKLISENTLPQYAIYCCLGLQFASNFAAPIVGLLASVIRWSSLFVIGGILLAACGTIMFLFLTCLERRGHIQYAVRRTGVEKKSGGVRILVRNGIIKFSVIAAVTGAIRTSLVFWLPTYISQRLGFSPSASALIYTAAGIVISLNAFASAILYRSLKNRMRPTLMISFFFAAVSLLAANFVSHSILNLGFMVFAIFASNCADSLMWNIYCPGLRDTGMVSTATGYLDFLSYIAASVTSTLFALAVEGAGWSTLIMICFSLMCVGFAASLTGKKRKAAVS